MSERVVMRCLDCGDRFEFFHGAGQDFVVFTCERCGGQETVSLAEAGAGMFASARRGWATGLQFMAGLAARRHARRHCPGALRQEAAPRCPHCASPRVAAEPEEGLLLYD